MRSSFHRHLVSKAWILLSVSKQNPRFTEEDESDMRLVHLGLACEDDGVAPPNFV